MRSHIWEMDSFDGRLWKLCPGTPWVDGVAESLSSCCELWTTWKSDYGSCLVKPIINLQLSWFIQAVSGEFGDCFFFSVYYLTWNDSSRIAARFLSPSLVKNKRRCRISNPRMQSCIDV